LSSILINGHPTEQLSVLDRGFQYGDGLFETLRIRDGQPQHWLRHMKRLVTGCERLSIAVPDLECLRTEAVSLCRGFVAERGESSHGVLKITVTRGSGGRGYATTDVHEPTRVLAVFEAPEFPASHRTQGVTLRLCEMRLGHNPVLAGIKHLNRLEQVLARSEWDDPDIAEGVLLDNNNNVIEGTMSNLFCVQESAGGRPTLLTPTLSRCGVRGVTRDRILEIAMQHDIPGRETDLQLADFQQASEVFISNSLIGIWPVRRFMQQDYAIGPITRRLSTELERATGSPE
jgi:4-amino-4-deoxychorismate lyase